MHKKTSCYGVLALAVTTSMSAMPALALEQADWTLVWSDEFNSGEAPSENTWSIIEGDGCPSLCGFGNNELQTYTKNQENLRIEDGKLVIEALYNDGFTSAKITSQKLPGWQTGKIAMRAKIPMGVGTWPAFWMLPDVNKFGGWPKSGEIDIMEHVGHRLGYLHGTIHTEAFNGKLGTQKGGEIYVPTISSEFHEFSVEWTDNSLRWFLDGEQYFEILREEGDGTAEWPFDHPYHVILNLAVGGDWGGQKGVKNEDFPTRYEIDWVRVWQQKP